MSESSDGCGFSIVPITMQKSNVISASNLRTSCCMHWLASSLDAGAREFLDQKDLVRVSSTQAVGCVDKDGLDQSLGSKIAHPLEAGTDQSCAAITVVFEDPLRRHCEPLLAGEHDQRRRSGWRSCSPPDDTRA